MMIEVVVQPDPETTKHLFQRPWALINFKAGAQRAIQAVERDVEANAPKASGRFLKSIRSSMTEADDPYRLICRVESSIDYADVIEFGAAPHVVPTRTLMRWMQQVGMSIRRTTDPQQVAFSIHKKIAQDGLKPRLVFTQAFGGAEAHFHSAIDPVIAAIRGEVEYHLELRSSESYVPRYQVFVPD